MPCDRAGVKITQKGTLKKQKYVGDMQWGSNESEKGPKENSHAQGNRAYSFIERRKFND